MTWRARAIVGSDHDPVGVLEILDGRALAQELRVRYHCELGVRAGFLNDALDIVAGADRNRRLGHHHGKAVRAPPAIPRAAA